MERRLRLRREAEVRAVRARGRAFADGPLVARVLANGSEPPVNRYAVIAGKKVGGAVKRNRAKRLVREALRHLHPMLIPGSDVAIVVRGTSEELPDYQTARASLERILRRAGLFRPARDAPGAGSDGAGGHEPGRST
jgi:ribonuclease P protein component